MKYVNRVTGKDGIERLYLRKRGEPAIRLTSPWGSQALEQEVNALVENGGPKPLPGSLSLAIRAYELENPDFAGLRASTKREYRYILAELDQDFGALAVSAFQAQRILQLRNLWAKRGHRAANIRLQVLKNVLRPCIIAGLIVGGDPFALVPQVRRPAAAAEPHQLWPETVVTVVIDTAIANRRFGIARAVALARYGGVRRGDLVKLTSASSLEGRVRLTSSKRKVPVDIPADPRLVAWLRQMPEPVAKSPGAPIYLIHGKRGYRYTEDGLGQELAKLIKTLHRAGLIESDRYDLHGLRHTRGVELALAGCSDAQGAAQLGQSSAASFAQYRRQADRIRMSDDAGELVAKLRGGEAS